MGWGLVWWKGVHPGAEDDLCEVSTRREAGKEWRHGDSPILPAGFQMLLAEGRIKFPLISLPRHLSRIDRLIEETFCQGRHHSDLKLINQIYVQKESSAFMSHGIHRNLQIETNNSLKIESWYKKYIYFSYLSFTRVFLTKLNIYEIYHNTKVLNDLIIMLINLIMARIKVYSMCVSVTQSTVPSIYSVLLFKALVKLSNV